MLVVLAFVLCINASTVGLELWDVHQLETKIDAGKVSTITVTSIAKRMRDKFNAVYKIEAVPMSAKKFQGLELLAGILAAEDPLNGHVLYLEGEVKRAEAQCEMARVSFQRYIEVANRRKAEMGESTDGDYCYDLPRGYCRQRAGYIEYLLALGFYAQALSAPAASDKIAWIGDATNHLNRSYEWYRAPFNNVIPSKRLERSFKTVIDAANAHRPAIGAAVMKQRC